MKPNPCQPEQGKWFKFVLFAALQIYGNWKLKIPGKSSVRMICTGQWLVPFLARPELGLPLPQCSHPSGQHIRLSKTAKDIAQQNDKPQSIILWAIYKVGEITLFLFPPFFSPILGLLVSQMKCREEGSRALTLHRKPATSSRTPDTYGQLTIDQ